MAKKKLSKTTAKVKAEVSKPLDTSTDQKQRVVNLFKNSTGFLVEKLELNFPYSKTFKKESEARQAFEEQIADSQN